MSDHRGHRHHVVDEHLATAARLHLTRLDHDGFVAEVDGPGEHAVHQASSIDALLKGAYDGDLTLGELLEQGDLGLGTVQALDGELVVLDGVCYQVTADGVVRRPAPTMRTPFAVVCRFDPHREDWRRAELTGVPACDLIDPLRDRPERVPTVERLVDVRIEPADDRERRAHRRGRSSHDTVGRHLV
ncbi:MAG: acetolactate decarboxylase, partial [Actinomycetota bacterium]